MIRAACSTVFSILVLSFLAAPALGDGVDVSKLPRVPGATLTYAGPASTIYVAPGSVEQAAGDVAKALAAEGWQAYSDPFSKSAPNAPQRIMTFKKGPQAITAFVTVAPAQGNATSVSYTAVALANDLPFPKDATEIGFAPERPHLRALSGEAVEALLEFYRKEMTVLGYRAWTGKPEQISEAGAFTFFTRDDERILVFSISSVDAGGSRIDISPVAASVLTAKSEFVAQEKTPEQEQASAEAHQRHEDASAEIEALFEAELGKALRDLQQSIGVPQLPAARSGAAVTAMQAESEEAGGAAPAEPAPQFSADDLTAEEIAGYPVPKRRTASGSENTQYRVVVNATVPMDVPSMLDFYRRELTKLGWTEEQGAQISDEGATVRFTAPDGPASLVLERQGGDTIVTLAKRMPEVAKKAGVLPKPGQAKVLIGNPGDSEAVVTVNEQTFRVKPGDGAKNPDGPALDLAPGQYQVTLKMDGETETETIDVGADEAWGLLIGLGGLLPLQVY